MAEKIGREFVPQGIVSIDLQRCLVCGSTQVKYQLTAKGRLEDAERITALFGDNGRLCDYHEGPEPGMVVFHVYACTNHLRELSMLQQLCLDGVITAEKVKQAKEAAPVGQQRK